MISLTFSMRLEWLFNFSNDVFQNFFSKITKKLVKIENLSKIANNIEDSRFCNFWVISTCNTSKESIFVIKFNFIQKKYNWKNHFFPIFLSKPMLTNCLCLHISQICAKKFQNFVHLCFGKVLKLEVTKGELIISNGLEMVDDYLPGGAPPLPLVGLKTQLASGKSLPHSPSPVQTSWPGLEIARGWIILMVVNFAAFLATYFKFSALKVLSGF